MNRYLLFGLDSDSESSKSSESPSSETSDSESSESLYDEYSDEESKKDSIFRRLRKGLIKDVYLLHSSI